MTSSKRGYKLYKALGEEALETCQLIDKINTALHGNNVPTVCGALCHIIYAIHEKYGKDVLPLDEFLDDIKMAVLQIHSETEKHYLEKDLSKNQ